EKRPGGTAGVRRESPRYSSNLGSVPSDGTLRREISSLWPSQEATTLLRRPYATRQPFHPGKLHLVRRVHHAQTVPDPSAGGSDPGSSTLGSHRPDLGIAHGNPERCGASAPSPLGCSTVQPEWL